MDCQVLPKRPMPVGPAAGAKQRPESSESWNHAVPWVECLGACAGGRPTQAQNREQTSPQLKLHPFEILT